MDFVNLPLFGASALVFAGVLAGLFSTRFGLSFLLAFLVTGILAGEDGIGGYRFDDFVLSFWVGNLALAIILLDGGLRTAYSTFRTGLRPAAVLASLGVLICAGIVAAAGVWLIGLDWLTAALLGAIVGSTDSAAVFGVLARSGVRLNERVAATLEIESGVNDPMAVYLTLALIALLAPAAASNSAAGAMALTFVEQFGWGGLVGLGSGFVMSALARRVAVREAGAGILALLLTAGGLAVFSATGLLGGSGFLAIYLFGLVVANRATAAVEPTLPAMDGYAWFAQAGMFLLLGLLVTPSQASGSLGEGLAMALVLIFVARPLAVWLCLLPFRFTPRETWFISWVGLRGAVPIVLSLFPLMAGTAEAGRLFHVAFVVVLSSLLLQGTTIGPMARWLGVALPEASDEERLRVVFKDFALDPATPVGEICLFYGLPPAPDPGLALGAWLTDRLKRPPVVGDSVQWGGAAFAVRSLQRGQITGVGIGFLE